MTRTQSTLIPRPAYLFAIGSMFAIAMMAFADRAAHAADPNPGLRFVPSSASSLVVIDVRATVGQPFVKELRKEIIDLAGATRDVQKLKREAGVDIFADVTSLIYAGTDKAVRKSNDSLLIVTGKFDAAKLATFYAKRGKADARSETHEGREVWSIGTDSWLATVDGHALIGAKSLVKEALKAGAQGPAGALRDALPAEGQRRGVWGAIVGSSDLEKLLGKAFAPFKGVKSASFGLDLRAGILLEVSGQFADAGGASAAAKAIAAEIDAFRKDPELKDLGIEPVFAAVDAKSNAKTLQLKLNLGAAMTAELAKNVKALFE